MGWPMDVHTSPSGVALGILKLTCYRMCSKPAIHQLHRVRVLHYQIPPANLLLQWALYSNLWNYLSISAASNVSQHFVSCKRIVLVSSLSPFTKSPQISTVPRYDLFFFLIIQVISRPAQPRSLWP